MGSDVNMSCLASASVKRLYSWPLAAEGAACCAARARLLLPLLPLTKALACACAAASIPQVPPDPLSMLLLLPLVHALRALRSRRLQPDAQGHITFFLSFCPWCRGGMAAALPVCVAGGVAGLQRPPAGHRFVAVSRSLLVPEPATF